MAITIGVGAPKTGADAIALKVGALFGGRLGLNVHWKLNSVAASTLPHRSFHCGLQKAASNVLDEATFVGWRYHVLRGEQVVVEAILGGDGRVVSAATVLGDGDQAASAAVPTTLDMEREDLRWLVNQPEAKAGDFEVCYLRVASGVLRAWWLLSPAGDREKDIVLPVLPSHPCLRGTEREWLWGYEVNSRVAKIAQEKLDQGRILVHGVPGLDG